MKIHNWLAIPFLAWTTFAQAVPSLTCKASGVGVKVFGGQLKEVECDFAGSMDGARTRLYYNDTLVIDGAYPTSYENGNKPRSVILFQEGHDIRLGCPSRLFLLDLTAKKPRVFAFGVRNACNEFHWSSWGKKRSVIAIKRNVKFIYENGKMTLPKKDNDLFSDIQPPRELTPVEKLEPFVEELQVR